MTNEARSQRRSGKVLRTVLGVLALLILVPIGLLLVLAQTRSEMHAQTIRPAPPVSVVPVQQSSIRLNQQPTIFAEASSDPRFAGSMTPILRQQHYHPEQMKLAAELRGLAEDDQQRASKLKQLTERLVEEFDNRHKHQAEQIEQAAQQLELLKTTHDERLQRKDEIVQRRIESLIGQPDVLKWAPNDAARLAPKPQINFPAPVRGRMPGVSLAPKPAPRKDLERAPRPAGPDDRPVTRQPPAPIEFPTATASDVFAVVRQLSSATLNEQAAELEYESMAQLHEKKAIPDAEWMRARLKLELARRESVFAQAEIDALAKSLQRDLEFAESRVKQMAQLRDFVKTRVESGTDLPQELIEHEGQVAIAERHLMDARAKIEQLVKAQRLVQRSNPSAAAANPFGGQDPFGGDGILVPGDDDPFE